VYKKVPETKNKTIEEISSMFRQISYQWRCVADVVQHRTVVLSALSSLPSSVCSNICCLWVVGSYRGKWINSCPVVSIFSHLLLNFMAKEGRTEYTVLNVQHNPHAVDCDMWRVQQTLFSRTFIIFIILE
jgi:hypothetical protein